MRKLTLIFAGLCLLAAGPGYAKEKGKNKKAPPKQEKQIEPKIFHMPAPEAPVSKAMILNAKIVAAWHFAEATVYYRRAGTREYKAATLERSSTGGYAATIPAKEVAPPGVEYYIASKDRQGKERRHFAGPDNPHQVVVRGKAETQKFRNYLARHKGNHSRARASFTYIDFGKRTNPNENREYSDYYWQLELDYTYRILKIPYYIRLGYRRLRSTSQGSLREPHEGITGTDDENPGIDWGFAELDFRFHDLIGLKTKLILGATREGFSIGGGGALRIGYDPGTNVSAVFEGAQDLGWTSYLRLAWDTVPGFPMGASVGVTNYPGNGDLAVQLLFDVEMHLLEPVLIAVRAGYQARDYRVGGPAIGGWLIYEF
jgi:hypothetical protein